jgi:hypothetical protein
MPKTHAEPTPASTTPVTAATPSDALSPALRELLAIFEQELAEVRFPNVDGKILADLAARVDAETQRVEELRAQLDTAHAGLVDVKARLQKAAEQGLGYARVYAAGDADLLARLAEVNLGGEPRRRKLEVAAPEAADGTIKLPPRRGRPRKQVSDEAIAAD